MTIRTNAKKIIQQLNRYKRSLPDKQKLFLEKLAQIGIDTATIRFSTAQYDGTKDVTVQNTPEWENEKTLKVKASGSTILFIEFGSGITYGYGDDPSYAKQFNYGPGTWSDNESKGGKHHWADPKGWYYTHGKRSLGNPPARAMYDASKEMRNNILIIAKEVFNGD